MPAHHPDLEFLIDYAVGSLWEAPSLVIATHLALCPNCRRQVKEYEAIGGLILEREDEAPVSAGSLSAVLARLDAETPATLTRPASAGPGPRPASAMRGRPPAVNGRRPAGAFVLPQPLRSYVGGEPWELDWKPLMPGLDVVEIDVGGHGRARLMRLRGGTKAPRHTHEGMELTLVLAGGYTDDGVHYRRGDLAFSDRTVDHEPAVDPGEDCLCLAVTDAPLRLTGPLTRFLNPLLRL